MRPKLTPRDFVDKWRKAELKERSASQEHFIDLCRMIGHPTPAEVDPTGHAFTFEAGVGKLSGGQGWADVWKKGYFAWEYKGRHANLDTAYHQLLQYRESLLNPPLLVVSDMETILIHTNFTNMIKRVERITPDDLLTPDGQSKLHAVFYEPERFRAPQTTEQVTQEAAIEFARLADLLRADGNEPHEAAHFLIRLLFCLFAEDTNLLPKDVFTQLVHNAKRRPDAFEAQLQQLFSAMSVGGWFGVNDILHFDGHIFDDDKVLALNIDALDILANVSTLDWSSIEPAIFGALFERSLDPSKRAQLGAHFTSKEDILLIVEPVLMAPLRSHWEKVRIDTRDLARRRDDAKTSRTRNKLQKEIQGLLMSFAEELATIKVLDPACGSGNFLYVSLKQLLDLWKEISVLASDLGLPRFAPLPNISPSPEQLIGIELNEYAQQLAQATIWIGYIQWLHENGFGQPPEPILKPLDTIQNMDALIARDDDGNLVEAEWPKSDIIIGNPPFLGGKRLRTELGDEYVDNMFGFYDGRVAREADLVCYWFEKARFLVEKNEVSRVGLLATQGIRGGANRKVLERIKETGNIFWAQSDRNWILDGATVHVSMVGFDNGEEKIYFLDGQQVSNINPDLTSNIDITQAKRLSENSNLSFMGVTPAGPFDVTDELAREWLDAPINPNGRPNSDVIKPYFNGTDINRRPRGVWTVDFGVDTLESDAALYEKPFEYIKKVVYPIRLKNNRKKYREQWWLYAEPRPALRKALEPLTRYIGTSMVSKHRIFSWIPSEVIPANLVIVIARDDDYLIGVIQSKIHLIWSENCGTQLREASSGQRYTPTTTFETFPFPWPPGLEQKDNSRVRFISEAARKLDAKRNAWLNPEGASEEELNSRTLTNLYNQHPTWLELAHHELDEAVFDAYGWPHNIGDDEILSRLLLLNLERGSK